MSWMRQFNYYYSFNGGYTSDAWWQDKQQRHARIDAFAHDGLYHVGLTDDEDLVSSDPDYAMYYSWPGGVPGQVRRYWGRYTDVDYTSTVTADNINVTGGGGVYPLENGDVSLSMMMNNFYSEDTGVPYFTYEPNEDLPYPGYAHYSHTKLYNRPYISGNGTIGAFGFDINNNWVRDYHQASKYQTLILTNGGIYLQNNGGTPKLLYEKYRSWYNYRIGPVKNAALIRQNILRIINNE